MTDMTTHIADEEVRETAQPASRRKGQTEFMVYFVIIFIATLPLATLTWAMQAIKTRSFTDKGPMARAWTQARIITPMIFNACSAPTDIPNFSANVRLLRHRTGRLATGGQSPEGATPKDPAAGSAASA